MSRFSALLESEVMSHHKAREYAVVDRNDGDWMNRILIGTPITGLVRTEWMQARYGQICPTNWSMAGAFQPIYTHAPMRYLVADAQNLICKAMIEQDFEWLLMHEHDNVMPIDCFVRINEYMRNCDVPVVSGLYFTRSEPPEPLIYRGRGNSYFQDWKIGDKVWCDGVPMGCTLIHNSIIKALWERSPEYNLNGTITRRVFSCPENAYMDPEKEGSFHIDVGTSDLAFCNRLIREKIFDAAGWPEYQKMKYPLLVDTNLFLYHIEQDGRMFPVGGIPKRFLPDPKPVEHKHGSFKGLARSNSRTAANAANSRTPSKRSPKNSRA